MLEHDFCMNELLRRLKATYENGKTQEPLISVKKFMDKYRMYDETTHWRPRKPKVKSIAYVIYTFYVVY